MKLSGSRMNLKVYLREWNQTKNENTCVSSLSDVDLV